MGGAIGKMEVGAQALNSHSTGDVTASGTGTGGFVGGVFDDTSKLVGCSANGEVSGQDRTGGLVGNLGGRRTAPRLRIPTLQEM